MMVAFGSAASDAKKELGCVEDEDEDDDDTAARAAVAAVALDVESTSGGTKLEHACEHVCPPVAMIALRCRHMAHSCSRRRSNKYLLEININRRMHCTVLASHLQYTLIS